MKNILLLASLVLSAVSAASTFAQDAIFFRPDALMDLEPKAAARIGMSREELVAQFGKPSETLGDQLWAYWNFRAAGQPESAPGDTLVVVFTNDKVSLLRITERRLVEAAVAKARVNAAKAATVAKK